jgi:hypothetical protein
MPLFLHFVGKEYRDVFLLKRGRKKNGYVRREELLLGSLTAEPIG